MWFLVLDVTLYRPTRKRVDSTLLPCTAILDSLFLPAVQPKSTLSCKICIGCKPLSIYITRAVIDMIITRQLNTAYAFSTSKLLMVVTYLQVIESEKYYKCKSIVITTN